MAPFSALQVANSGYSISLAVIQVFDTEMILKISIEHKNVMYYSGSIWICGGDCGGVNHPRAVEVFQDVFAEGGCVVSVPDP